MPMRMSASALGELGADRVERLLGVAEEHVGVVLEEDGVLRAA